MLKQEFMVDIERIKSAFGDKNFTGERLDRVWSFCKELDHWDFTFICNKFIDEFKFAPLPKEFRDAANKILQKKTNKVFENLSWEKFEEMKHISPKCRACSDNGSVPTRKLNEPGKGGPYIWLCSCEAGRSRKEKWPMWNGNVEFEVVS